MTTPFHSGEIDAQTRAGVGDVAARVAGFIRPFMPDQHRDFFANQPFLILAAADAQGRPWVTLMDGPEGFVTSPDRMSLVLGARPDPRDPLAGALEEGTDVGVLGIELATRRRNRLSGRSARVGDGLAIAVRQSFGNCPQYIHDRHWRRVSDSQPGPVRPSDRLDPGQIDRIRAADTMFIGTGHHDGGDAPSNGYDASHRGGAPGFVQVVDATHLRIPDYAGNNFFNSIGNILGSGRIGLLFVDFATGGLLHVTGRARIDWTPGPGDDPGAQRLIDVTVEAVLDRPAAVGLRWGRGDAASQRLVITRKKPETLDITSFYLAPADGKALVPFRAGQHLPVTLDLGDRGQVERSYSLSAAPDGTRYRLSIKREAQGLASRALHDGFGPGDEITARSPAGDFVLTDGTRPVVLASAGVGVTPMVALLQDIARGGGARPVWFVQGARNGRDHAFGAEIDGIVRRSPHVTCRIHYSQPDARDRAGRDYDQAGRVTAQTLLDLRAGPDALYMLCGPAGFVADLRAGLEAAGVLPGQIRFETF
ncbi:MAG: pyridoxamine 5'-phosphate oxidase family protein [Marinibacterium sp.]|nr:pyridoxamine 5'-phosphate oxidase family protein [Marinibacterium sp.]